MRAVLVAVFVAISAVSLWAQTPTDAGTPAQTPAADARAQSLRELDSLRDRMIEVRGMVFVRRAELEQMRAALARLSFTYDRMTLQPGGVYMMEGVTLTLNGTVITADDAFIQNGEVRLGANARVTFSPK
jgi:hypothetical protein